MTWPPDEPLESQPSYDSVFDGPEAKLWRRDWEEECKKLGVIDRLLGTLTPDDAQLSLFTYAEVRQWDLKHTRKRAE